MFCGGMSILYVRRQVIFINLFKVTGRPLDIRGSYLPPTGRIVNIAPVQTQNAVSAYFTSKQIRPCELLHSWILQCNSKH